MKCRRGSFGISELEDPEGGAALGTGSGLVGWMSSLSAVGDEESAASAALGNLAPLSTSRTTAVELEFSRHKSANLITMSMPYFDQVLKLKRWSVCFEVRGYI